jgi:hypothetical protein
MEGKPLVFTTIAINSIIGLTNRILQIVYYCKTTFINDSIGHTTLTFCFLPTGINLFMILVYLIFHNEEMLTPIVKIKHFFIYLFSFEILFPIGVHKSFKTKYSDNADNVIVTMRVINALHVMFVALPQLLIILIHSSALNKFDNVDVANIIFSFIFIFWSIWYYFICIKNEDDYDSVIYEYSK